MSNYSRGAAFERRVSDLLVNDGYVVYRSAGSHGHADLVAMKAGQTLLVQCKTNGRLDPADWNGLYDEAWKLGALPILALRATARTVGYVRLTARKSGRRGEAAPSVPWSPDELVPPMVVAPLVAAWLADERVVARCGAAVSAHDVDTEYGCQHHATHDCRTERALRVLRELADMAGVPR